MTDQTIPIDVRPEDFYRDYSKKEPDTTNIYSST